STVRSRSFFVSSSGLNHTTELGLMSIITNSQPAPGTTALLLPAFSAWFVSNRCWVSWLSPAGAVTQHRPTINRQMPRYRHNRNLLPCFTTAVHSFIQAAQPGVVTQAHPTDLYQ